MLSSHEGNQHMKRNMKQILIYLTEEQLEWLHEKKEETGANISEIIRRCINKYFTGEEKEIKEKIKKQKIGSDF